MQDSAEVKIWVMKIAVWNAVKETAKNAAYRNVAMTMNGTASGIAVMMTVAAFSGF